MEEDESVDSLFESSFEEDIYEELFPDVFVCEEGGKNFKWEYAHEKCSGHPTQFWEIWPDEL